jgi:hypothetical protein
MAPTQTRPDVLIAALLYLVTAYHRSPCPGLAACIARHFDCLAQHPKAGRLLSDVALASSSAWDTSARDAFPTKSQGAGLH